MALFAYYTYNQTVNCIKTSGDTSFRAGGASNRLTKFMVNLSVFVVQCVQLLTMAHIRQSRHGFESGPLLPLIYFEELVVLLLKQFLKEVTYFLLHYI